MKLEEMSSFFDARVSGYDAHMLDTVKGCAQGYQMMANYVPEGANRLLDLGCGTGLQLEAIFKKIPEIQVTGIDLCNSMLKQLSEKFSQKAIRLIQGSYFDVPFEPEHFDVALSFQTLHHFKKEKKLTLYKKIFNALEEGGIYLECDYMVEVQEIEDEHFRVLDQYRKDHGIDENVFLHYDTPCTVENQKSLLEEAGFEAVMVLWRMENTTLIRAIKKIS